MTDTPNGGLYLGPQIIKDVIVKLEYGSEKERKELATALKRLDAWPKEERAL